MPVSRMCMRAQISRELIRRIAEGVYAPGERLVELQLAAEFDTSQAPVREAFRELEALRLVETTPYKGTRVRAISEREQREASEARGALEEAAARSAAAALRGNTGALRDEVEALRAAALAGDRDAYARHNDAFHRRIVEASGNAVMLRLWASLDLESRTRIGLRLHGHDLATAADSHAPIVDALDAGDGDQAGLLLREHARRFGSADPED